MTEKEWIEKCLNRGNCDYIRNCKDCPYEYIIDRVSQDTGWVVGMYEKCYKEVVG